MAADLGCVADESEVQSQSYAAQAHAAEKSADTLEKQSREHDDLAAASANSSVEEHHKKRSDDLKAKAHALREKAVHAHKKAAEHHKTTKEAKDHAEAITSSLAAPVAEPHHHDHDYTISTGGRFRQQYQHSYFW
jgi:peptidoglycan hydrolase CwlO-like protein